MLYTIYKVTNMVNDKIYIGKHQTLNPNDNYYGSGVALKNSMRVHGKENFKKEVLFVFESEQEMNLKEKELITEEFVARTDTYNMGVGGEGGAHFKGKKHSAETIARIKESLGSDENKQKFIDVGRKAGFLSKGRKLSVTARQNMSDAQGRRHMYDGQKKAMSEETKKRISESLKKFNENNPGRYKNLAKKNRKPLSKETKEKLRQIQLKRWQKIKGL